MRKSTRAMFAFFSLCALSPAALPAQSAADLRGLVPGLTQADAQTLLQTGKVTRFFQQDGNAELIPDSSLSSVIHDDLASHEHTVGAEALYLSKPGVVSAGDESRTMLRWYNTLRSISSMKGVEYFSQTRGRMRVLFNDSYVVDNAQDQNRIPDPIVDAVPAKSEITIKQNDSDFGNELLTVDYLSEPDAVSLQMKNLTPLTYFFIPVAPQDGMMLQLLLVPYRQRLIFYGCVSVKALSIPALENHTRDSFMNRIDALHTWFESTE